MKPETLLSIKKDIQKFAKLYEILEHHWNGDLIHGNGATYPETIQVGVLLQNMGFISTNCANYSHEEDEKQLIHLIDVLKAINEYHDKCYMIHYAWNEVDCIYNGSVMSEYEPSFD
jgi:hypothetical protein